MHTFAFGIFDSFDRGNTTPAELLRGRIDFALAAEQAGIDHYHVTEHHGTPLSVCPSPNIFLAAIATRTRTMRIGALVYVLPMYNPLRLAEEVATLDQLTGGRIDLGIGAGISPYELGFFGIAPEEAKPKYQEHLETLTETLRTGRYRLGSGAEALLSVRPVQTPYPALWYASSNPATAQWAGTTGVNLAGRWNSGQFAEVANTYWQAVDAGVEHVRTSMLRIGPSASVVVGETDAQARELFETAGSKFTNDLLTLWHENDNTKFDANYNLENMIAKGNAVVGSVESVTNTILEQVESARINYFEATLAFGTMTAQQARGNLTRFAEVMANVRAAYPEIVRRKGVA